MENISIKSVESFSKDDFNTTTLTIIENDCEKEIVLQGNGSLKIAVEA